MVNGFGVDWLRTIINLSYKLRKKNSVEFYVDCGTNYGLCILLIEELTKKRLLGIIIGLFGAGFLITEGESFRVNNFGDLLNSIGMAMITLLYGYMIGNIVESCWPEKE